jgi:hypothetical protein
MLQRKAVVIALVSLVIGFGGGFILRSVISPVGQTGTTAAATPALPVSTEPRGTQYFVAHIDEARQIVAGCRDGSVRGGECATAEDAIIKVEAQERTKRFLGN